MQEATFLARSLTLLGRSFFLFTGPRRYEDDWLSVLPVAEFLDALRNGSVF